MFTLPTEPQSIGKVISNSLALYKVFFLRLLPFSFLYGLLVILPNALWQVNFNELPSAKFIWATAITRLILPFILAVLLHRGYRLMINSDEGFVKSLSVGLKKYFVYFIAGVLYTLAAGFGTLILVLPGIFLCILLFFYCPCIVIDNSGIFNSLKHSAQLVWKNWWRTFAVLAASAFLVIFAFLLLIAIINIPISLLLSLQLERLTLLAHWSTFLALSLVTPWFIAIKLALFYDLKLRQKPLLLTEGAKL